MHWYTSLNISIAQNYAQAHTPAFIHSHQSSLFVHNLLKFSIDLRSIAKHSHPLSPFSELIGTYSFLIHFLFISFSFCISLAFFLFLSCVVFWIFVFLFQSFIFLFSNISEYLYAHVLVVAQ